LVQQTIYHVFGEFGLRGYAKRRVEYVYVMSNKLFNLPEGSRVRKVANQLQYAAAHPRVYVLEAAS
jgi:hypothetical protein